MTLDDLRNAITDDWLTDAEARVRKEPDALETLFARAGRKLGSRPIKDGWTAGEAGRALLLAFRPDQTKEIYHHGDAKEKLAVLKALPLTFENARALMTADWHTQHPTPFFDFLKAEKAKVAAQISVAPRFAQVVPAGTTIVIQPPVAPVRL